MIDLNIKNHAEHRGKPAISSELLARYILFAVRRLAASLSSTYCLRSEYEA